MKQTLGVPRLLGAAACALAITACEDGPVASGANCTEVSQTAAEAEAGRTSGLALVRVNVVSHLGAGAKEAIGLDGVELYQGGKCLRLAATSTSSPGSLQSAMGRLVAEAAVGANPITHVLLRPAEGQNRLRSEKIALTQMARVEEGVRTEIYLALDSVPGSDEVAARFVAAGVVPAYAGAVMVAEPGHGGTMSTATGFSLELGPESVRVPTVYSVVEHDVGGVSSLMDIAPAGQLAARGRLRFRVDKGRIAQGLGMADYGAHVGDVAVASTMDGNTVGMDVSNLGLIEMRTSRSVTELPGGIRIANPARTAPPAGEGTLNQTTIGCTSNLSYYQSYYYSNLEYAPAVRITDCVNTAPYVHIVLVNLKYANTRSGRYPYIHFPSQWYSGTNNFLLHTIKTLGDLNGQSIVALNGWAWDGDYGVYPGGTGRPRGMVYIDGARRGSTIWDREAVIGFTRSDAYTGTYAAIGFKPAGGTLNLGAYSWNAVPSTTSIMSNGACTRVAGEGDEDHWSAVGFGNGILMLVSSRTGGFTTSYQLCSVFEALNIRAGAIRLDGSGSAAMYWGGVHINPLSGGAALKYGQARHIAYAIGATEFPTY